MGCGASTDNASNAQAPVVPAAEAKPVDAPENAADSAAPAPPPPPPKIGNSEWSQLQHVGKDELHKVIQGTQPPAFYLVVHDNKNEGAPRLSVANLTDGKLAPVRIKDKGRGLKTAQDLECLFVIDPAVSGKKTPLYVAMQSNGKAFLFKVSRKRSKWVAHGIKTFMLPPPDNKPEDTNCEGARAYLDGGKLFVEYASRGGLNNGAPVLPWVARYPLDIKAIRKDKFAVDMAALEVTYWPENIDNDPRVRQCTDLGQAPGMAKYGQLFAAAKDDEENEKDFRSYIMERLPGAQAGGVENCKPLYKIEGSKIEAIYDISKDVSLFATDDEGRGSVLTVFHRHSGLAWMTRTVQPEGDDPRMYGISGISPVDPSIKKTHDESSSESEESEEEEEEEKEEEEEQKEQQQEEQQEEKCEEQQEEGGGGNDDAGDGVLGAILGE